MGRFFSTLLTVVVSSVILLIAGHGAVCEIISESAMNTDGGFIMERCEILFASDEEILFREDGTGIIRRAECTYDTIFYRNDIKSTSRALLPIEDSDMGLICQEASIEFDRKSRVKVVRCCHLYEEIGIVYVESSTHAETSPYKEEFREEMGDIEMKEIGIIRGVAGRIRLIMSL